MPQVPSVGTDETVYSECLAQGSCILRAQSSAGPGINRPGQRLEEGEGTASQGPRCQSQQRGEEASEEQLLGRRESIHGWQEPPHCREKREAGSEVSLDGDGRRPPAPRCAGPRERVASA